MDELPFRPATLTDIPALVALVTSAYRGDTSKQGWTTEADLLDGQRIDAEALRHDIERTDSRILLALENGEVLACAHVAIEVRSRSSTTRDRHRRRATATNSPRSRPRCRT